MIHELKTLPIHFQPVSKGLKRAELRKNDRNFKVGDSLLLWEWSPEGGYTGRSALRVVTHVADVGAYLEGYALLSMGDE